jgi:hypothetical protein
MSELICDKKNFVRILVDTAEKDSGARAARYAETG